jgi:Transposase DDE domain
MVYTSPSTPTTEQFDEAFFQPAMTLLHDYCRQKQVGGVLPDARFLRLGLERCLGSFDSGRDFLQYESDNGRDLARATFFDALHQPRRLEVITEVSERLVRLAAKRLESVDWLKDVPGLEGRSVWAVDGHQIEHACHALRDAKDRRVPPGSLYALNLRQGLVHALAPHQGDGKRSHEVKVFKKVLSGHIARSAIPARAILVADMAFIDNGYWTRLRLASPDAPALITRQKENMNPLSYGQIPFDRNDPFNAGVLGYEMVGFDNCLPMYRVTYRDQQNGADFVFLTTDSTLAPGVVALLYRLRWKIEKTYNTCKSKLHQTKAWANGTVAQEIQSHLTAITHNLLALLLQRLSDDHDITEKKLVAVHDKAAAKRTKDAVAEHPFFLIARLALQLSCQFIRTVRNLLLHPRPWKDALPLFKLRLHYYI